MESTTTTTPLSGAHVEPSLWDRVVSILDPSIEQPPTTHAIDGPLSTKGDGSQQRQDTDSAPELASQQEVPLPPSQQQEPVSVFDLDHDEENVLVGLTILPVWTWMCTPARYQDEVLLSPSTIRRLQNQMKRQQHKQDVSLVDMPSALKGIMSPVVYTLLCRSLWQERMQSGWVRASVWIFLWLACGLSGLIYAMHMTYRDAQLYNNNPAVDNPNTTTIWTHMAVFVPILILEVAAHRTLEHELSTALHARLKCLVHTWNHYIDPTSGGAARSNWVLRYTCTGHGNLSERPVSLCGSHHQTHWYEILCGIISQPLAWSFSLCGGERARVEILKRVDDPEADSSTSTASLPGLIRGPIITGLTVRSSPLTACFGHEFGYHTTGYCCWGWFSRPEQSPMAPYGSLASLHAGDDHMNMPSILAQYGISELAWRSLCLGAQTRQSQVRTGMACMILLFLTAWLGLECWFGSVWQPTVFHPTSTPLLALHTCLQIALILMLWDVGYMLDLGLHQSMQLLSHDWNRSATIGQSTPSGQGLYLEYHALLLEESPVNARHYRDDDDGVDGSLSAAGYERQSFDEDAVFLPPEVAVSFSDSWRWESLRHVAWTRGQWLFTYILCRQDSLLEWRLLHPNSQYHESLQQLTPSDDVDPANQLEKETGNGSAQASSSRGKRRGLGSRQSTPRDEDDTKSLPLVSRTSTLATDSVGRPLHKVPSAFL